MLDQILALVKSHGEASIVNNSAVPNEHNEAALGIAAQSIFSGIQGAVSQGNLPQLMSLLGNSGDLMSSPIVKGIISTFVDQLKTKLSLAPDQAANVASNTIPQVLTGLLSQLGASKGGAPDLMAMAQNFISGQANSSISSLTSSLDVNKDGKVDLQDAMAQLGGGENSALAGVAGKILGGMLK